MAKSSSVVLRTSFNCLWRCLLWQHLPGLYSLLSWDKTYIFGALTCPGCLEVENCPRNDNLHSLHQTCVQIGLNQLLLMFTWHHLALVIMYTWHHLAHCSWETCSIHRSRCGTRSLDKVGHIGNLLPLFPQILQKFARILVPQWDDILLLLVIFGHQRPSVWLFVWSMKQFWLLGLS